MRRLLFSIVFVSLATPFLFAAAEPSARMPVDDEGHVVDFARDVAPIFRARCLQCHNEKVAKNDFRIDDRDAVMGYLEAGDSESSSIYADYMLATDPDMMMPPASHDGPLTTAELAIVGLWIDEGASWPDSETVLPVEDLSSNIESAPTEVPSLSPADASFPVRMWMAQGYLHPATIHFPVALLSLGGLFVVLGWKFPWLSHQCALACLFLGTLSSIAACIMGWSFAGIRGYGGWQKMGPSLAEQPEIFWHRWTAVLLTILAVAASTIALRSLKTGSRRGTTLWKVGLIMCALLVGAVGHQGGEMTYGKQLYSDMFRWVVGK